MKRKEIKDARQATFDRILANAPATFTAAQLRLVLRALVSGDEYIFNELASEFADAETTDEPTDALLLSVVDGTADNKLPAFALRLALTHHKAIPDEDQIDFLAEADLAFALLQPAKAARPKKAKASVYRRQRHKPKRYGAKHMFNKVTLIGRLGQNAEAKTAQNNNRFVALSLAAQESWKNDQGECETRTEWHRVYAWNKLANFAGTLRKGQLIALEGTLQYREIEDEAGGTKHRIAGVHTTSLKRLSKIEAPDDPTDGAGEE